MFGRTSKFEKELAKRIGPERAAAITKELGKDIVSNPVMDRGAHIAAEAAAMIVRARPSASPHEIAAEFVEQLRKQL